MPDAKSHAKEIVEQFEDYLELEVDEVEQRIKKLTGEYGVPLDEARRSTINSYRDEAGIEPEDIIGSGSDEVLVSEIDEEEMWVDVTVKLVELWEPRSDSIAQVGLVGDESGRIKFTSFATSELEELEEGKSYQLKNVVSDEYQGRYSIKLNKTTSIDKIDEDIEVGDDAVTVEGAIVDLQSGSGLIKRCPEEGCTRVLQNGRCSEHGDVDGVFDLRIKGVLDDGKETREVIYNKEATEELVGISLNEAQQMAKDALDTAVVADEIREQIVGRYYRITGPKLGRYYLANECEQITELTGANEVLAEARAL